jgi:hypothetical protein
LLTLALSTTASAQTLPTGNGGSPPGKPDLDVRLPDAVEDRRGFVLREPGMRREAALLRLRQLRPALSVRWDGMSGSPKRLASRDGGGIAAPAAGEPRDLARAFVAAHADLFGLDLAEVRALRPTSSIGLKSGSHVVYFTQTAGGLDTFDGRLQVLLSPDGSVLSISASTYADLDPPRTALVSAVEAVTLAVADVYPGYVFTGAQQSEPQGVDRKIVFEQGEFGLPPSVRLIVFPTASGSRLAWEVRIAERSLYTSYRILIDAQDGTLLYRHNTTEYADARRLDGPRPLPKTEEENPDGYDLATIPAATPESPLGWIDGAGTSLEGNNATSHVGWRDQPGLAESSAIYDYPFGTTRSALVNTWWAVNELHDWLYARGFDEQAGNFQADNFGKGGLGNDPLGVVVLEGFPQGNSFMVPPSVDGDRSWVHLAWVRCRFCRDQDGLTDAPVTVGERQSGYYESIVIHEAMHAVTNRRVGGPGDDACLDQAQSAALGESWSDLIGRTLTGVLFDGLYEGGGINRRFSHDLTYGDLCNADDTGCQEHTDGLIFSAALWDLRDSMEALDPAGGVADWEQLVVESLALTPCDPSMLVARDAVLDADQTLFGSAFEDLIWNAFANRGMGDDASSTGAADTAPVEGFAVPAGSACSVPGAPTTVAAAADGSNAILVTYDASGSSAVEIWRDDLDNTFDRPLRVALTDDLVSYRDTEVQGGKSYRYHVIGLGSGGTVCRSGASTTADATATGTCTAYPRFVPSLSIADGDPGCAVTLTWSAAAEGCPGSGEPIVYNIYRAPTPGFDPRERLLVGRTMATTFQDVPPENDEHPWVWTGRANQTAHYLVLAQHGTLADPPDHRDRGSSHILDWEPVVPTLGRTAVQFWDFESGTQGWTADNSADPTGGWVRAAPTGTTYGGMALAPAVAAGGAGSAWVTGDGIGNIAAHDCDDVSTLTSPVWDGTGGATLFSWDYWAVGSGNFLFALDLWVDNGIETVQLGTVGHRTAQDFETDDTHGWQRDEVDLASWITPTSTMSVTFAGYCNRPFGEFGIDNVRVESATTCARSGLHLDTVTLDDTPPGWGNGNGVLEPGETARLNVRLRNAGSSIAVAPQATLRARTVGVLVHEETASFPDIPAGGTGDALGSGLTLTATDDAICDDSLVLEFELRDAAGTLGHASWSPELGNTVTETVFEDTFATDKGWNAQGIAGRGRFQRGDPVGTLDGASPANPEDDSPNDPDSMCYVTENGAIGGAAAATDVDRDFTGLIWPSLTTPWFDLTAYKRATLTYDLWLYDNSPSAPSQDYLQVIGEPQNSTPFSRGSRFHGDATGGWVTRTEDLTRLLPFAVQNHVRFLVYDNDPDHIVEVGIDNVLVEGHRQVCDPLGIVNPPNGIGDTLLVGKAGGGAAQISWTASAVDGSHDGAAYYELYVSSAPDSGFAVTDTAAETQLTHVPAGGVEYFKVSAVNAAGTSGDEPAP